MSFSEIDIKVCLSQSIPNHLILTIQVPHLILGFTPRNNHRGLNTPWEGCPQTPLECLHIHNLIFLPALSRSRQKISHPPPTQLKILYETLLGIKYRHAYLFSLSVFSIIRQILCVRASRMSFLCHYIEHNTLLCGLFVLHHP